MWTILDICPVLTTFTFNMDWCWWINPTGAVSNITKRPHLHISTISLHMLPYAFEILVGAPAGAASNEDWSLYWHQAPTQWSQIAEDEMNALNKFVGPSGENGRYDRWNWLTVCLMFWLDLRIVSDERSDDDYDGDNDDDDSGEWVSESDEEEPEWGRRVPSLPESDGCTMELTRLLEDRLGDERRTW